MFAAARRLVSQNKVRLKEDGFDLDLTYLTDQIICMGLPAEGPEALYRNPIDTVVRFLEKHHSGRYKVFNLCNERSYDISKFGAACASFPFDDHGAPPLALVVAFCHSAKGWLLLSLENVVAVHCKAGKGRTGLMACCLVMHLGYQRTAADAIAFYNGRRTKDGRGLTVPSQRRYVYYYERVLRGVSFEGVTRTLRAVRLRSLPAKFTRLVVSIHQHGAAKPEAPSLVVVEIDPRLPLGAPHTARCQVPVSADLRISLADDAGHELCKLWMHPAMEPEEAIFVLDHDKFRSELDVSDKGALPDGFTLAFLFDDAIAGNAGGAAGERDGNDGAGASGTGAAMPPPPLPSIPSGAEVLDEAPTPPQAAYADNYEGASPGAKGTPAPSARESTSAGAVKSVRM